MSVVSKLAMVMIFMTVIQEKKYATTWRLSMINLIRRRMIGLLTWFLYPNTLISRHSCCARCWVSWEITEYHSTKYKTLTGEDQGCHPLCENCICELTPEKRLPYYRKLFIRWLKLDLKPQVEWGTIREAVIAEGGGPHRL
jgi:hypothetical protein